MSGKPRRVAGIAPAVFAERWDAGESDDARVVFSASHVNGIGLRVGTQRFLCLAGLPASAAPFLSFAPPKRTSALPTIGEVYYGVTGVPARYREIGGNGSGDPVCIDTGANDEIVYLNHDDHWRRVAVNSSVATLAHCLLEYRDIVDELRAANVELADVLPPATRREIARRLNAIDRGACRPGRFWHEATLFG